jgi:predicted dinucleotide-binding enzyme
VLGRGNVGGGLARLWQRAGHDVTTLGTDGGDASNADVIVVAVPSGAIKGKVAIDATNAFHGRSAEAESLAHEVKQIVGGPTAKSFNLNFARIYDQIGNQRAAPSNLYAADDDAREVTEQLIRDAGYDPVHVGGLDKARLLEDHIELMMAVNQGGLGAFFYRMAQPGGL